MKPYPDIIGKRFGKLTVIDRVGSRRVSAKSTVSLWRCRCDCGGERITGASPLQNGRTTSCGCARRKGDRAKKKSPAYSSWQNMMARCTQPSNPAFEHYQKHGITVCDRWQSFENFLADMGERPTGLTIDRIDNNGHYEPGNCRWASKREQANNRRTNNTFNYRDTDYTLADLARATGASKETLRVRLVRPGGWSVAEAVETPTIPRHLRHVTR